MLFWVFFRVKDMVKLGLQAKSRRDLNPNPVSKTSMFFWSRETYDTPYRSKNSYEYLLYKDIN